jgi:hypothetical protein
MSTVVKFEAGLWVTIVNVVNMSKSAIAGRAKGPAQCPGGRVLWYLSCCVDP